MGFIPIDVDDDVLLTAHNTKSPGWPVDIAIIKRCPGEKIPHLPLITSHIIIIAVATAQ